MTELYDHIAAIAESGVSVLVVEQFANLALRVADYAAVMAQGVIQAVGEPGEIEEVLAEAYLGSVA